MPADAQSQGQRDVTVPLPPSATTPAIISPNVSANFGAHLTNQTAFTGALWSTPHVRYDEVPLYTGTPPALREDTMLEQLLKLYMAAMATGVTSPMPHFFGPPGSGKSTVFQQLADMLDVKLHVVNVSRISPLGLEGLEMPDSENSSLRLLISEMWTKAEEGDIYLFDEFLRGFPEVYNGLLDIFTAREVAGFKLPKVFIAGASNSVATYDKALEDRLLHIPVTDPRKGKRNAQFLATLIVNGIGLLPEMSTDRAMYELLEKEVFPTYAVLDQLKGGAIVNSGVSVEGTSVRKLIGQAQLRHVQSDALKELISVNNYQAMYAKKPQYVVLLTGRDAPAGYEAAARAIADSPKLSTLQYTNIQINLQLIEMGAVHMEGITDDDIIADGG